MVTRHAHFESPVHESAVPGVFHSQVHIIITAAADGQYRPDLCHCGGLWEGRKIAAMAEVYTMGVAPHNPLGPVANAAALHFDLSTPNFLIQEDMLTDVPWRWEVVQHSLKTEG